MCALQLLRSQCVSRPLSQPVGLFSQGCYRSRCDRQGDAEAVQDLAGCRATPYRGLDPIRLRHMPGLPKVTDQRLHAGIELPQIHPVSMTDSFTRRTQPGCSRLPARKPWAVHRLAIYAPPAGSATKQYAGFALMIIGGVLAAR
jgi:hypothetical protein